MLRTAKELEGHSLQARDGLLGHITDFYFDDLHWQIRYAVVRTGGWLLARKVLISPLAMRGDDPVARAIPVDLTMQQVRHSPAIDTDKPVSRQREEELRRHYGWLEYWDGGLAGVGVILPVPPPAKGSFAPEMNRRARPEERRGDPTLRSCHDTRGYALAATDGEIGEVQDFLIEDASWRIHDLIVAVGAGRERRRLLIEPQRILRVSWMNSLVAVDLSREAVAALPAYAPA